MAKPNGDQAVRLSVKQEKVALMLAEDDFTNAKIADLQGISINTLKIWRRNPVFAARVEQIKDELCRLVIREGLGNKERRIKAKAQRHQALLQVIKERAEDPTMADVPGGKTGLVVRQYKFGKEERVEEYVVDIAPSREMSNLETEVAKELGQLVDVRKLYVKPLSEMTEEELEQVAGMDSGMGDAASASDASVEDAAGTKKAGEPSGVGVGGKDGGAEGAGETEGSEGAEGPDRE